MTATKVLIGATYGALTVCSRAASSTYSARWVCACQCGATCVRLSVSLTNGSNPSCGCKSRRGFSKVRNPAKDFHGLSKSRAYAVWKSMKKRCTAPTSDSYRNYGARGITVCDRWAGRFLDFLEDMGHPPPGMSIDRIDNSRGYEPGNCRWATRAEQACNRRANRVAWLPGVDQPMSVPEAAMRLGITYQQAYTKFARAERRAQRAAIAA